MVRRKRRPIGLFLGLALSLSGCVTAGTGIEQSGVQKVHHTHTSHRGAHIRPGMDAALNAAAASLPDCCS
ncbi:hypothetical protein [Treponema primitia]|uniref:hypothetical protein n=1 Tax=Treponema primitia TaxID=88058 RepID=UPI0002555827|nr:hypothetical protein [Treponema primitia]